MTDIPVTRAGDEKSGDGLDNLLDAFEEAWKQGQTPSIDRFLSQAPTNQRLSALRELVALDFEYRVKMGESIAIESYLVRFPELKQADLWPSMAAAEARIRARLGQGPNPSTSRTAPRLGNYFLLDKFPKSGQGDVFLAFDPERRQQVLIKQLKADADAQARDLFIQE